MSDTVAYEPTEEEWEQAFKAIINGDAIEVIRCDLCTGALRPIENIRTERTEDESFDVLQLSCGHEVVA